jgi:hypothetical protein
LLAGVPMFDASPAVLLTRNRAIMKLKIYIGEIGSK